MPKKEKNLSQSIADDILAMITIDKKYAVGDKLPNENELSKELKISRTTLREAIRTLIAHNILEIKRGKTIDNAVTGLKQKNIIVQVARSKYAINPKYFHYGALKDRDHLIELVIKYEYK